MLKPILSRTNQWWQPKAGNLLSGVYLAIYFCKSDFYITFLLIFPAVFTILGIGLFGYFFNDLFDLEADKKANKSNMLQKLTQNQRSKLLISALILALAPWIFLPFDRVSGFLLATEFLLLIAYAMPPIRLKERGVIALINDALYAYSIPFILAFQTFNLLSNTTINWVVLAVIFGWQFFVGLLNILIHQIEDYENDLRSQTKTWVTSIGKAKARKILLLLFWPMMLLSFILFLGVMSRFSWKWYFAGPLLYVIFKFVFVFYYKSFRSFLTSNGVTDLQKINIHYHLFLPYWHSILLVFIDDRFVIIVGLHYLLFNYSSVLWWFKAVMLPYFFMPIMIQLPSKMVNYAVYYFRIFILRESSEEARREHYKAYMEQKIDDSKKKTQPNIAIVSANKNKYTETFIRQHETMLKEEGYYLHRFYGGYLPTMEVKKGPLLYSNQTLQKWQDWISSFFDTEKDTHLRKAFVSYLINNNINLVIAEFGQSGAEISDLCQEAGVPLLVVFYGYDAHHQQVVAAYQLKYKKMFNYASKIIGVSKDIVATVEKLGAPKEKVMYLPCAIDLKKFKYHDHSQNAPIFLAVGRFSETKSPHLTILAFNEVLKEIPDAKLIFIGKDGGGELFEACHILVKALQIETNVVFKGIATPEEVFEHMKLARVFVQHSVTTPINRDKEGTPVAIMEAMATGLPVVSTRHAGIEEVITSGENGFLVMEYDYLDMAKMMISLGKNDQLTHQIGLNAATSILNNELISSNRKWFLEEVNKFILKNE